MASRRCAHGWRSCARTWRSSSTTITDSTSFSTRCQPSRSAPYRNADEGWGIPTLPPYPGDQDFSWHLIEGLTAEEFDLTTCQEMLVDHAFTMPMALLWPEPEQRPVRTVPLCINTVQHPLPSAARCYRLGQAIGRAVEAYERDLRVLVIG